MSSPGLQADGGDWLDLSLVARRDDDLRELALAERYSVEHRQLPRTVRGREMKSSVTVVIQHKHTPVVVPAEQQENEDATDKKMRVEQEKADEDVLLGTEVTETVRYLTEKSIDDWSFSAETVKWAEDFCRTIRRDCAGGGGKGGGAPEDFFRAWEELSPGGDTDGASGTFESEYPLERLVEMATFGEFVSRATLAAFCPCSLADPTASSLATSTTEEGDEEDNDSEDLYAF